MATVIRRPFALASALKTVSKPQTTARFFYQAPAKPAIQATKSTTASTFTSTLARSRPIFRRTYVDPSPVQNAGSGTLRQRLLYGGALVGGTFLVANLVFNRETREDGGMPAFERAFLNETFLHTGMGVGIIAIAARALHRTGWSVRLMTANPWLVFGGGLALSIGTMYGAMATPPEK